MVRTRTLEEVVRIVAPVINDWELFYVVVEDLAKRIYGFPRDPDVVELLVNITEEDQEKLGRFLTSEFLERAGGGPGFETFRDRRGPTVIRMTQGTDPFDLMTIGRRTIQDFSFSSVFVASVEDMVLRELRSGGRKRLLEAVEFYSYWRNHMDIGYMVRTSRQLGVYDRFIKMKRKGDARR